MNQFLESLKCGPLFFACMISTPPMTSSTILLQEMPIPQVEAKVLAKMAQIPYRGRAYHLASEQTVFADPAQAGKSSKRRILVYETLPENPKALRPVFYRLTWQLYKHAHPTETLVVLTPEQCIAGSEKPCSVEANGENYGNKPTSPAWQYLQSLKGL